MTSCSIYEAGCDGFYRGDEITLVTVEDEWNLSVVTDKEDGWEQKVCLICRITGGGSMRLDDLVVTAGSKVDWLTIIIVVIVCVMLATAGCVHYIHKRG